jgi:hypothetical protein
MKTAPVKAASANEVLHNTREDHNWKNDPVDITTTGGIQRAIVAQWAAIQALADYIDGVATGRTDDAGKPVKVDAAAAPTPFFGSDPVAPPSTAAPAPAA